MISIHDSALCYLEGESQVPIDGQAIVSDADGDAQWNGGSLTAQITVNAEADDRLSVADNDGDDIQISVAPVSTCWPMARISVT